MNIHQNPLRLIFVLAVFPVLWLSAQSNNEARRQLYSYIDSVARTRLEARRQSVAQIHTRAEAEGRKAAVREKILRKF